MYFYNFDNAVRKKNKNVETKQNFAFAVAGNTQNETGFTLKIHHNITDQLNKTKTRQISLVYFLKEDKFILWTNFVGCCESS